MLFRIKHIPNMLVRVFTVDKYYICEECHKLHKRDGKEIRLDVRLTQNATEMNALPDLCKIIKGVDIEIVD